LKYETGVFDFFSCTAGALARLPSMPHRVSYWIHRELNELVADAGEGRDAIRGRLLEPILSQCHRHAEGDKLHVMFYLVVKIHEAD